MEKETVRNDIKDTNDIKDINDIKNEPKAFTPYIPAEKEMPELTLTSLITGILLAIIFGAANAYLGLRVGLTVSASIPAAVISLAVTRVLLKRTSVLESNLVQTIGSAGESLAAGVIFTVPVLFLWAAEGRTDSPAMLSISLVALCGGVLGVLFMIPLRNSLIVKEHGILPYPEGTACAEVLLAGEKGGASAKNVFTGMGAAAVSKFLVDGVHMIPDVITAPLRSLRTEFSLEVYPALIGVGYICGARISSYMFAGGMLGWFVLIPAIIFFGGDAVLFPGTEPIAEMYATSGASAIWSCYLRYIGAGMVAAGGIISLLKSLPLIITTFVDAVKGMKDAASGSSKRTEKDLDMRIVLGLIAVVLLLLWLLPQVPVSLPGALLILLFGFFFGAVSSRIVGLVGSSNSPVSGMTIATLLFVTLILKMSGNVGMGGMIAAITISSVVCIIAAIAGDTSQDLKTGFLLGSTPKMQQIGELIGVIVSAAAIGSVLVLLNKAWGFGTRELSAPQATLMKMIVEGVMDGNLPWALVFIGMFTALVVEILQIPVLPVAIGLYLPLELSTTVMLGGVVRYLADQGVFGRRASDTDSGTLFCSGMIAGEGIVGIILALFAVAGLADRLDLSGSLNLGLIGALVLLAALLLAVLATGTKAKKDA